MLKKLVIKNYAIIDELSFAPGAQLNIITGETGAGKSIMLGALSLILGERADSSVLINPSEKCIVEGHFQLSKDDPALLKVFEKHDLDFDPETIIRREIAPSGKSRAFINDTPVNLSALNELTSGLMDMHRQFDHISLTQNTFQRSVLDDTAGLKNDLAVYQKTFATLQQLQQELQQKQTQKEQLEKEADYIRYLLEELQNFDAQPNEIETVAEQLKKAENQETILSHLAQSQVLFYAEDTQLISQIKRAAQLLQAIENYVPEVKSLIERLDGVYEETKDIATEIENLQNRTELNTEDADAWRERLDEGYRLFKKHNVQTTEELLQIQQTLSGQIHSNEQLAEDIHAIEKAIEEREAQLQTEGQKITAKRQKQIPVLEKKVNLILSKIDMPNAMFKIQLSPLVQPAHYGFEDIQFMLDANKSGSLQPLYKAASGGELSRIMLAVKTVIVDTMYLSTMIFDEVDTGISGEAAHQVGLLLKQMGQHHQVICITHQAQLAAKGDAHYYVYKEEEKSSGKILTRLKILNQEERVEKLAEMIAGKS